MHQVVNEVKPVMRKGRPSDSQVSPSVFEGGHYFKLMSSADNSESKVLVHY